MLHFGQKEKEYDMVCGNRVQSRDYKSKKLEKGLDNPIKAVVYSIF
jgi:hypothetical protein